MKKEVIFKVIGIAFVFVLAYVLGYMLGDLVGSVRFDWASIELGIRECEIKLDYLTHLMLTR